MSVKPLADPAEALFTTRDIDGRITEELPSAEDVELVERIRAARTRGRARRRGVWIAALGFAALLIALEFTPRSLLTIWPSRPDDAATPSDPPAPVAERVERDTGDAAPEQLPKPTPRIPRESRAASSPSMASALPRLPSRAERVATPPSTPSTPSVASPPPVAPQAPPDVRAEVKQAPHPAVDGAVDYTVTLSRAGGEPLRGADVRLRGVMADGLVVEARLDPADTPGVYHALVAVSSRGPRSLTLRVARANRIVELPVADPPSGTRSPTR